MRLSDEAKAWSQEIRSGSNGQFLFANVVPGPFRLTVTSPGFATRELSADLGPGQTYLVPPIILTIAMGAIEVHVKDRYRCTRPRSRICRLENRRNNAYSV